MPIFRSSFVSPTANAGNLLVAGQQASQNNLNMFVDLDYDPDLIGAIGDYQEVEIKAGGLGLSADPHSSFGRCPIFYLGIHYMVEQITLFDYTVLVAAWKNKTGNYPNPTPYYKTYI
jgi:hypothetical protein